MDVRSVLATKRDGGELSEEEIRFFFGGYVAGEIPDYQMSALAMAIFIHGMSTPELNRWTRAMLESGRVMDFSDIALPKVDKHSTGGVGDKVSIPLAPAVAACGVAVPMISGRGLGHTGGTLDKLESMPGFDTGLEAPEFRRVLEDVGLAFGAQTADLVPADRKLYALRDVTGLIASIPLIASSILSKKLAEGLDALLLDIKYGSGAFLSDPEQGALLARTMIDLAESFGVKTCVYQTSMAEPLGRAVGHALEIAECFDCLEGQGPEDLAQLVRLYGGEMLQLAGIAETTDAGAERIDAAISSGEAKRVFERSIEAQGGDPRCLSDRSMLAHAPDVELLRAESDGVLGFRDVRAVGMAALELGGGRRQLGDEIDEGVGFVFLRKSGAEVACGDELVEIHHTGGHGLDAARALLAGALTYDPPTTEPQPLILARLGA